MITLILIMAIIVLFIAIALVITVGGIFIIPALIDIFVLWLIFHKRKSKK